MKLRVQLKLKLDFKTLTGNETTHYCTRHARSHPSGSKILRRCDACDGFGRETVEHVHTYLSTDHTFHDSMIVLPTTGDGQNFNLQFRIQRSKDRYQEGRRSLGHTMQDSYDGLTDGKTPASEFCDNKSVVSNSTLRSSMLQNENKHNTVNYLTSNGITSFQKIHLV
jgi:hypothetical protein